MPPVIVNPDDAAVEEEAVAEENRGPESPIIRVAKLMVHKRKQLLNNQEHVAESISMSRRHLMRLLSVLAEASLRQQQDILNSVITYIELNRDQWQPLLFCGHVKYDETPLALRAQYSEGEPYAHNTKTYVIEVEWQALLQHNSGSVDPGHMFLIHGAFAPAVRVGQNSTAETIHCTLQNVNLIEWPRIRELFGQTWRIAETDEAGANLRAEEMWRQSDAGCGTRQLQIVCAAHKCHSVASRVWQMFPDLFYGFRQTMKVLKSPGCFQLFTDTVVRIIIERLKIVYAVPQEAVWFREDTLRFFRPCETDGLANMACVDIVCNNLLNGDWRDQTCVQHVCVPGQSCCTSKHDTVAKIKT